MAIEKFQVDPVADRAKWLELRKQDVTASAAGALLGVHDYVTAFSLWALKAGKIDEDPEETPAMQRGRLLEPVAVELIKQEFPDWEVERPNTYYRDTEARIGATPDLFVRNAKGRGVVQIKSVEPSIFRRKWVDEETREIRPPLWVAVQAIVEADLTKVDWAATAALVIGFGIDLHMVDVPIHAGIMDRLKGDVATFWQRVKSGEAPPVDYGKDGETINALYGQTTENTIDLRGDNELPALLAEDEELEAIVNGGKKRRKEIKNAVLSKMGTNAFAKLNGWTVAAPTANRKGYEVEPCTYRTVRAKRTTPNTAAA
jgi:hypothetical protein